MYELVLCILSFSHLLSKLLVVQSLKNCIYNIFIVISYTIILLAIILTTELGI